MSKSANTFHIWLDDAGARLTFLDNRPELRLGTLPGQQVSEVVSELVISMALYRQLLDAATKVLAEHDAKNASVN